MKKIITTGLLLVSIFAKGQTFAEGGVGLSFPVGMAGTVNVGYRVPFVECANGGGWVVSGGYVASIDGDGSAVFNLKAGKGFRLSWYSEFEIQAGWGWNKVSNDNKARNSKGVVYSASYVHTVGIGAWVINGTFSRETTFATIGMRIYFVK